MAAQEAQQEMQRGDEGHRCSTILPVSVAGVRTEAIVVQKGQCREQDACESLLLQVKRHQGCSAAQI